MPELPDISIYIEELERRVLGQELKDVRVSSPFLVRTAVPPLESVRGHEVVQLRALTDPHLFSGIGNASSSCASRPAKGSQRTSLRFVRK